MRHGCRPRRRAAGMRRWVCRRCRRAKQLRVRRIGRTHGAGAPGHVVRGFNEAVEIESSKRHNLANVDQGLLVAAREHAHFGKVEPIIHTLISSVFFIHIQKHIPQQIVLGLDGCIRQIRVAMIFTESRTQREYVKFAHIDFGFIQWFAHRTPRIRIRHGRAMD